VLVTGKYELKRPAAGGGPARGRYTLIVRQSKDGWKIIDDHTTTY
jgi:ketosteroid isomerase-like protein